MSKNGKNSQKMAPDGSQMAPNGSQITLNNLKKLSYSSKKYVNYVEKQHISPKTGYNLITGYNGSSQMAPDGSQMAPDGSQMAPDGSQMAPDGPTYQITQNSKIIETVVSSDLNKVKNIKHINKLTNNIKKSDEKSLFDNDKHYRIICEFCNKTFSKKSNLSRHIKKSCKGISSNIPSIDNESSTEDGSYDDMIINIDDISEYKCEYCNLVIKHKNSYYRHLKHYCKSKILIDELDKKSDEISKKITLLNNELINEKMKMAGEQENSNFIILKNEVENLKKTHLEQQNQKNQIINNHTIINNTSNTTNNMNNTTNINNLYLKLNEMSPLKLLNTYFKNNPSLKELTDFLEKEKLTDTQLDNLIGLGELRDINSLAEYFNEIMQDMTKRYVDKNNIKGLTCGPMLFLNDGSARKYIARCKDKWEYTGDVKLLDNIVFSLFGKAYFQREVALYYVNMDRKQIVKKMKQLNDWTIEKIPLIEKLIARYKEQGYIEGVDDAEYGGKKGAMINAPIIKKKKTKKTKKTNIVDKICFENNEILSNISDNSIYVSISNNGKDNINCLNNSIIPIFDNKATYRYITDCGRDYKYNVDTLDAYDYNTNYVGKVIHDNKCKCGFFDKKIRKKCWKYIDYRKKTISI